MGTAFLNYHVRTEDVAVVHRGIEQIGSIAWIAAEPINGWVSVYPYRLDITKLAQTLRLPVISLEINYGIAFYRLFENGVLVDEYDSCPDDWGAEYDVEEGPHLKTPESLAYFAPSPEKLLPYCLPESSLTDVETVFHSVDVPAFESPDAFSVMAQLFRILGLETRWLYSGYGLVEEEGFPLIFVGEERLSRANLTVLLDQTVPDTRSISASDETFSEFSEKKLALIRRWLELGANPDGYTPEFTLVMRAAHAGCIEAVEILLKAGANAKFTFIYMDLETYWGQYRNPGSRFGLPALVLTNKTPNAEEIVALLKSYGAVAWKF